MTTVCVSGYFNPLQPGHYRLFEEAKKLGDKLIVIVNNDKQVKLKGSVPMFKEGERMNMVQHIDVVNEVFLSIDTDRTICETLKLVKPDIFANGGDQKPDTLVSAEQVLCKELGIEMAFNVGGEKTDSSSDAIERLKAHLLKGELKEFARDFKDFEQVISTGDWETRRQLGFAFKAFVTNLKHVWGIK